MITHVLVRSRRDVENIIASRTQIQQPWSLISIYGTVRLLDEGTTLPNCQNIISLKFSDVSDKELDIIKTASKHEANKVILFNEQHAKQIIEFVNKINKQQDHVLVVHCNAGISRSGAVGLFVCRYLHLDEKMFRAYHPDIQPNFYIYNILYTVSGMKGDYEKFWQNTIPLDVRYDK